MNGELERLSKSRLPTLVLCLGAFGAGWCVFVLGVGFFQVVPKAAKDEREGLVKSLVFLGASPNTPTAYLSRGPSATALHFAALNGNTDLVEFLVDHGANMNARSWESSFSTPLDYSIRGGHFEVTRLLVDRGARLDIDGRNLLLSAILADREEIVRLLLDVGMGVLGQESDSSDRIFLAAIRTRNPTIVRLVADKALHEYRDAFRHILPLPYKDIVGNDFVAIFEEKSYDEALAYSVSQREAGLASFLYQLKSVGGDLREPNALQAAIACGDHAALVLMLEHGAAPSVTNSRGKSPLHIAIWKHDGEAVQILLSRGADTQELTRSGETLIDLAIRFDFSEGAKLLDEFRNRTNGDESQK